MSEGDYRAALGEMGLTFSGEKTNLTEIWVDAQGLDWWVTKPSELTAEDRAETIDRLKKMRGIGVIFGPH